MVMTTEQAAALIASAKQTINGGGDVPEDMRCQYPSKPCGDVRTTKRGGGLHRLCSFHRSRANKNQWLVDQRRRMRKERESSSAMLRRSNSNSINIAAISPSASASYHHQQQPVAMMMMMPLEDAHGAPLCDEDLQILQALLFDDEDDDLSDCFSDFSDVCMADTASPMEWTN